MALHNGDVLHDNGEFAKIRQRVLEKSDNYLRYEFGRRYNDFLKTFFDLAQEFDSLEDFYRICVAVPLEMTGFETALYLYDKEQSTLLLVCDCVQGVLEKPQTAQEPIKLSQRPYEAENSYLIPIYRKSPPSVTREGDTSEQEKEETKLFSSADDAAIATANRILGMLEVHPLNELSEADKFFFTKYSNRIGYNLHNRLIALQNVEHIRFINNLVMDIEHNVIVPNMYFKHLFNLLRKNIHKVDNFRNDIKEMARVEVEKPDYDQCIDKVAVLREDLLHQHQQLVKHHANISLFLESLFRREHFERGQLVLRLQSCSIEKDVILPQLDFYASRLRTAKITVERPKNILEEEFQVRVDVGLLAQVYANLFSNAAKYTKEIIDHSGNARKAMAYGRELVNDYGNFVGKGIKFNVFTTGPHLSIAERTSVLEEGIRGKDSDGVPGTGHGLAFIRYVIEMHGGSVGYEPTSYGNNFFFILPLSSTDISPDLLDSAS